MDIVSHALHVEAERFTERASIGLQVLMGVNLAKESPAPLDRLCISTARWAETELSRAELGDARRTKRLVQLAQQRAAQPNASIPQACGSRAAIKVAYRFYENDDIDGRAILLSHQQATIERLAQEKVVLAVQDTTQLDFTDHPATAGLGVLNDAEH